MSGNDQELKEYKKQIQMITGNDPQVEKPFFAKKVMRAIDAYEAGRPSEESYQRVYQLLKIALFMGLLLFPTLTEAII